MALALTTTAASAPVSPVPISPVPGAPPYVGEAARRFPQLARVGDLMGRQVLQPIEGQHVLGRVAGFLRDQDGSIIMRVRFGGVLGFNTRLIDVPIGSTAIMGEYVAVLDLTPKQLAALPNAKEAGAVPLPSDTMIRVPIVGPFH
jgi:hypothetical protein